MDDIKTLVEQNSTKPDTELTQILQEHFSKLGKTPVISIQLDVATKQKYVTITEGSEITKIPINRHLLLG